MVKQIEQEALRNVDTVEMNGIFLRHTLKDIDIQLTKWVSLNQWIVICVLQFSRLFAYTAIQTVTF